MQRTLSGLSGSAVQRHALLLLVVVLLAGVLGMHALSLHGLPVAGSSAQAVLSVQAAEGGGHHHGVTEDPMAGHTAPSTPPGGGGHGHGGAELCLAILLALTAQLILAVALRRVSPGVRLRDLLPRGVDPPTGRSPRARGPSLATLCLLRC